MPVAYIPAPLRSLTGGLETMTVAGDTVGQVIDHLDALFPGMKARLCDGDRLRPGIAAAVDTEVARLGLLQPVKETSEVHFLPAIGGGEFRAPIPESLQAQRKEPSLLEL